VRNYGFAISSTPADLEKATVAGGVPTRILGSRVSRADTSSWLDRGNLGGSLKSPLSDDFDRGESDFTDSAATDSTITTPVVKAVLTIGIDPDKQVANSGGLAHAACRDVIRIVGTIAVIASLVSSDIIQGHRRTFPKADASMTMLF